MFINDFNIARTGRRLAKNRPQYLRNHITSIHNPDRFVNWKGPIRIRTGTLLTSPGIGGIIFGVDALLWQLGQVPTTYRYSLSTRTVAEMEQGLQQGGSTMAKKSLSIVANEATKRVLGQLGSPLIQVAVKGRVVQTAGGNSLIIENVSTSKSTTLPIIASACTRKALSEMANGEGSHEVSLLGKVIQTGGSNVLLLDRVSSAQALPIAANGATRKLLAELAQKGSGEVTVKAKVVDNGGNKILVLAGEAKKK